MPADYGPFHQYMKNKRLEPNAVPTVFLWASTNKKTKAPADRLTDPDPSPKKARHSVPVPEPEAVNIFPHQMHLTATATTV